MREIVLDFRGVLTNYHGLLNLAVVVRPSSTHAWWWPDGENAKTFDDAIYQIGIEGWDVLTCGVSKRPPEYIETAVLAAQASLKEQGDA